MSTKEYPSEDSLDRTKKAKQTDILDVRVIDPDFFDGDATVFEVDLVNEENEERENITIIPRILFENTKDVQYRHDDGIVGKYTRALAMENKQAAAELRTGIESRRTEIQREIKSLKEKDSRLLHTIVDMDALNQSFK